MSILDQQAGSGFAYDPGTGTATVTVAARRQVKLISVRAPAGMDATMTIAPGGPNNPSSTNGSPTPITGGTITILAGTGFSEDYLAGQLGPGTILQINGSASYYVSYYVPRSGA